uniref:BHLH domain-containing protein n=1 Tax=Chenopodium quinoa TaxID=63459 RepID=A0A803MGF0_CHEQI
MDSVFQLGNGDRVSYLCSLMQSFGASYICLWTYSPDLKFLYCEDGHFQEEASSSTGGVSSISLRLFNEYKHSVFPVGNDLVPGLAFRDKILSLKLQEIDLQRLASIETQRRFYKTAVFFGCKRGEIELGMSNNQQNLEMKIQNLFSAMEFPRPTDQQQNKPSSSSSQSMDSPEYTSLFYNFASSSSFHLQPEQPAAVIRETHPSIINQHRTTNTQSIPITAKTATNTATSSVNASHLQHPLLQNIPFPTAETTDAALTKAYLAILSSPSSSSTGGEKSCLPYGFQVRQRASAFTSYQSPSSTQKRLDLRRQTLLKGAIAFYRGIHFRRIQELSLQGSGRPTSNQLHHMISERKRREKINESFQALRSLLPPGTKKDKASVLRTTKEYLSSLKAQLSELNKRNQLMEAQLITRNEPTSPNTTSLDVSTNERVTVRVTPVSESTSRERMVDLQVILRMETSVPDLVIRVLEFLKQVKEATMVSMEAQTHQETTSTNNQFPTNWVTFRLRIEGEEWDESAFIEAIRRLLADLAS